MHQHICCQVTRTILHSSCTLAASTLVVSMTQATAVWWMSVGINSLLSSTLVFSTDLKKNLNSTQIILRFWSR